MAKRRSRPVLTATISQSSHDYIEELARDTNFCKSTFIDHLIQTHKRISDGRRTARPE